MAVPVFPTLGTVDPRGWSFHRRPIWSTLKQPTISGRDIRYPLWSYPRREYELTYEGLRSYSTFTEYATLQGFFNQMNGAGLTFQFTDPEDFTFPANQRFGTGDGVTTVFQLVRTLGGFTEPIFITTGLTIAINGTPTVAWVLNNYGTVTFTGSPPANGAALTCNGTYNWLCMFEDDMIEFEEFVNGYHLLSVLKFRTFKF